MPYFGKICDNSLPDLILHRFIDLFVKLTSENKGLDEMDVEALGCVFSSQVNKFDRMNDIITYVHSLKVEDEKQLLNKIKVISQTKCNYGFG